MLNQLIRSIPFTAIFSIAAIIVTVFLLPLPATASAITENTEWSWTGNSPKVYSSSVVAEVNPTTCQGVYQSKDIKDVDGLQITCLMASDKVRFGTYYSDNSMSSAISFAFDSKMHRVWGACGLYNSCLYLPGTDTLVTKQYLVNGYVRSLVVYKNFTHRLNSTTHDKISGYDFDSSNPDYIFRNSTGYAWPIGSYGASENGKWLAIEFRSRGIGLLNIETLEMKRISTISPAYGVGSDPTSELAVSNDGRSLSIMGLNSGFKIYDNNPACGDAATDYRMENIEAIAKSCKTADINYSEIIDGFSRAFNPKFNENGGELSFYAVSHTNKVREVSLRANGYGGQNLDYLALGDSFTSGEGETDDKYYAPGTNDEFEKCHLSTRSYPYLLAGLYGIDSALMKSVACSGAKTTDVIGDNDSYEGQNNRLGKGKQNYSPPDIALAKTQAKYTYIPGRVRQEFFAIDNNSKVITIGIGGNDAGLMDKLKSCVGSMDTCNWASDPKKKEQTAIEIVNIFDKLVNTYKKIHEDSPSSKIYAIGYPKIIDENRGCGIGLDRVLDNTEKKFMNESVILLNRVVENAAKAVGIKYVDISNSLGNQVLCGSGSPSAMNDVRLGDDNQLNWLVTLGNEGFHPNSLGHSLVANTINKSISNLSSYSYCEDGSIICPDDSIKAPNPSNYWIPDVYHNYPTQQIANYVFDSSDGTDNRQKDLVLDSYSLAPNSAASVELTSNPISLGNFVASSDGSLNTSVTLPAELSEDYHTVHLYGTSYSGDPIELYQVIEFVKPDIKPKTLTSNQSIHSAVAIDVKNQIITQSVYSLDKTSEIINDFSKPEVKGDSIVIANEKAKSDKIENLSNTRTGFSAYVFVLLVVSVTLILATVIKYKKRR